MSDFFTLRMLFHIRKGSIFGSFFKMKEVRILASDVGIPHIILQKLPA